MERRKLLYLQQFFWKKFIRGLINQKQEFVLGDGTAVQVDINSPSSIDLPQKSEKDDVLWRFITDKYIDVIVLLNVQETHPSPDNYVFSKAP